MPWSTTRPASTARGYGPAHRAARAEYKKIVDQGQANCVRCGRWIHPAQPWHLDHDDNDRTRYLGAACARCNVQAGARKGNRVSNARRRTQHTQRW